LWLAVHGSICLAGRSMSAEHDTCPYRHRRWIRLVRLNYREIMFRIVSSCSSGSGGKDSQLVIRASKWCIQDFEPPTSASRLDRTRASVTQLCIVNRSAGLWRPD